MMTLVVAVLFYEAATSWPVYGETSPKHVAARLFGEEVGRMGRPLGISLHVVLRKVYSIVAFAIVGFCAAMATGWRRATPIALLIAFYSAIIELGQFSLGIREGLISNAFDVLCGAMGGVIAVYASKQWTAG